MNFPFFLFPLLVAVLQHFSPAETNQQPIIVVEKVFCDSKLKFGEKLIIRMGSGKSEKVSPTKNYDLKDFIKLSDAEKLSIVVLLLKNRDDKAETCLFPFNYNYSKKNKPNDKKTPLSKSFSIQIDALYMINRLCFSEAPDYTNPVIINTETGEELNNNSAAISEYYKVYDKWLEECLQKGVIDKTFPFTTNKYRWFNN